MKASQTRSARKLYGSTVQYADGTVVPGKALDIDAILAAFEQADAETRHAFLCVFAHDLTVAVRALLLDRPVSDADLDRVWEINECMHQLTSCANPEANWSAADAARLIRSIIETSFNYDLDRWIGHALAKAAATIMSPHQSVAAK